MLTAALALGLAGAMLIDRTVSAPGWVADRVEARLQQAMPTLDPTIGGIALRLGAEGSGQILLKALSIVDAQGAPVLDLDAAAITVSTRALLRGQVALRGVDVSGAAVSVVRSEDGRVALALGDAFGRGPMPSAPEIVARVDAALDDPRLAGLRRIAADRVTLRYRDRRAGRDWSTRDARLRLSRDNGRLDLFADLSGPGHDGAPARIEVTAESAIGSSAVALGVRFDGLASGAIATQSPALVWLSALDAPIAGAMRAGLDATGGLAPLGAALQIGGGALAPTPATRPIPFDAARAYLTYEPGTGTVVFDEIAVASPLGAARAEGTVRLKPGRGAEPAAFWGQMRLSDLALAAGAVTDRAYAIDGAEATVRLTLDPFELRLGSLRVTDADLPLSATGRLAATADGWDLALDARASRSDLAQVLAFWPNTLLPGTRGWVESSVEAGTLRDVALAVRSEPGEAPVTHLDLAFERTRLRFNESLPPVEAGAGRLTIAGSRLSARLDAGRLDPGQGGPVALGGTEFVIPDLRASQPRGETRLQATGSVTAVLAFLDNRSWRLLERVGRSPALATGQARVTGRIERSLAEGVPLDEIDMRFDAVLTDLRSDRAVPGRTLRADRLTLEASRSDLVMRGPLMLDGVAADATWRQSFRGDGGTVTATVALSPEALDAFGVPLPEGMAAGQGKAELAIALRDGVAPALTLDGDLRGVALSVPALGWSKPASAAGTLRLEGRVGATPRIGRLALSASGLTLEARPEMRSGAVRALRIERLAVDDWIDVSGRLGMGAGGAVTLDGGRLDLRGLPAVSGGGGGVRRAEGGAAEGGAASGPVRQLILALDRLQVTETIALTGFSGEFAQGRGIAGRFDGTVNGDPEASLSGRLLPGTGGRRITVGAADAGRLLRAAGLVGTVRGGRMRLDLTARPDAEGGWDGTLAIRQTRLEDAPGIAALLDAVSVVGLLDKLEGPGILFSEVDARFRLQPGRIVLSRASAVGPSLGLSLDGYYDPESGAIDLQGVLSPVYILNAIGRVISRQGEGLIGFTFTLQGTRDAPRVAVNPLSAFTPGAFRDIFRRPPPVLSE